MQLDALLQPLLAQLNSGVVLLDKQNQVLFFNQFIARRANVQLEQVQGQNLFDVFTDLPKAWLQRKLDSVRQLQVPAFSNWEQRQYVFKLPHLRPLSTGSQYMAQNCSIMPLGNGSDSAGYLCILIEDATDAFVYQQQLHASMAQLEQANRIDGLTGIYNRRYWQQQLQLELLRAERYQHPVSLLLFDLDKFKQLNDSYGHQGGDAVLTTVAERISALLRDTDIFGRYGGEEFGVVLPETALDGALMVANRICKTIAAETVSYNQQHIPVTLSIGVASFAGQSSDELIQQADIGLYNAKRQGRNCVCAYTDSADYLKR
ncbi:diguanylate cyclase [Rheinheimera sp.]|uniref:diguanylate cyclase n=1 Tax=Rheinheimera sp. TaxID=1869214 RepID=UPI0040484D2F